jgi:hypothetical protein
MLVTKCHVMMCGYKQHQGKRPDGLAPALLCFIAGVNATTAGVITFVTALLLKWLRGHFGKANLSRKTLVDQHFLI